MFKKIKNFFKKNKRLLLIFLIILIIILIILFIIKIIINSKTDGMENSGIVNVYYRTQTKENGWSKWSKNGLTSGDLSENYRLQNVQIKLKTKNNSLVYFVYNSDDTWSEEPTEGSEFIKALKVSLPSDLSNKYTICYRTSTPVNNWLEWTCDGKISGSNEYAIKAIQIKIIPKTVIKREYLKNYENNKNDSNIGF